MNTHDEEWIDRDAWRRRLGDAGAPTSEMDFVIRAEARRVLTPRTSAWWLPASLAAAVVLAVLLAQLQIEDERLHPLVDEYQIMNQRPAPESVQEEPVVDASAPLEYAADPKAAAGAVPPRSAEFSTPELAPPPAVDAPLAELANESVRERMPEPKSDNAAAPAANAPEPAPEQERSEAPPAVPVAPTGRLASPPPSTAITVTGSRVAKEKTEAEERSPEDWYAEIEALREAGRDAEADEELEQLEAAHPGWLAKRRAAEP